MYVIFEEFKNEIEASIQHKFALQKANEMLVGNVWDLSVSGSWRKYSRLSNIAIRAAFITKPEDCRVIINMVGVLL